MTATMREKAIEMIQQLPPEASVEEMMEKLYFLSKVERGRSMPVRSSRMRKQSADWAGDADCLVRPFINACSPARIAMPR